MVVKILVDEMYDGIDIKLKEFGYEAYSVKKLIAEGKKLTSDYSVIKYAEQNHMVVVTEDTEVGKACKENNIPCVLLDNETIFKIILEALSSYKNR
jgi:rRNA-processing protein FCF1